MVETWESIVHEIAQRAQTALPDAGERIVKAVAIVLSGGVSQGEHGWVVQSQSTPEAKYGVNGVCCCKDAPTAPHGGPVQASPCGGDLPTCAGRTEPHAAPGRRSARAGA